MLQGVRRAVGRLVAKAFPNDAVFGTFQRIVASVLSDQDDCTRPYHQNGAVYAAINAIAENVARPYYEVFREQGDEEVKVLRHPIAQIFRRPNAWQSGKQLVQLWSTYLDLEGGTVLLSPGRLSGQIPQTVYVLPGRQFKAVVEPELGLVGWKHSPHDGAPKVYSLEECLKVWTPDPLDVWEQFPPHKSVQHDLDGDRMAALYNRAFFKNGATKGGALTAQGHVEDDEWESIKERLLDKHSGPRNAHLPMMLQGGLTFEPSSDTHRDAEFPWLRGFTREQAALVYGVPHEVLGLGKKTFENVDAAWRNFWRHKLAPRCDLFGESVTHWLGIDRQGLTLAPDYSLIAYMQEDLTEKIIQGQGLMQLGYSQAKVNARLGLEIEDEPWADEPPPGFGMGGDGYLGGEGEDQDPEPAKPESPPEDEPDEEDEPAKAVAKQARSVHACAPPDYGTMTKAQADPLRKLDRVAARQERAMRSKIRTHFLELQREVVGKIKARADEFPTEATKDVQKISAAEVLFQAAAADRGLRSRVSRLLLELVSSGARSVREEAGLPTNVAITASVRKVYLQRLNLIVIVNRTVGDDIRRTVARLIGEGGTIQEVQAAVIGRFDMHRRNALRIARTEVQGAINESRAAQQQDEGIKSAKWLSSRDEEVRQSHRINGQVREIGDRFTNGLRWPGDQTGEAGEVINCRCRTISIIEDDDEE